MSITSISLSLYAIFTSIYSPIIISFSMTLTINVGDLMKWSIFCMTLMMGNIMT